MYILMEEPIMKLFSKDPASKIRKQYKAKLIEARDAQRSGEIVRYSELMVEAENLAKQLEQNNSAD